MAKTEKDKNKTNIAENKKARFNYAIGETYEAGIVLLGTEVKSCREGRVSIGEAYASFRGTELYLQNVHIKEYSHGNRANHDPLRVRKLLLHQKELFQLDLDFKKGLSIVPLKMYFKNGYAKVLLGVGKGKKSFDKRESIKKREVNIEIARKFRKP